MLVSGKFSLFIGKEGAIKMKMVSEIFEDINVKPTKSKLVLKWVVRVSLVLISGSFILGGVNAIRDNRLSAIEKAVNENVHATEEIKIEMNNGFLKLNDKINSAYSFGFETFTEYKEFNNKQLSLIIDYGSTNKDLLKKMLEINSIENTNNVQNKIKSNLVEVNPSQINNETAVVTPTNKFSCVVITSKSNPNDSMFILKNVDEDYINNIDFNRYKIIKRVNSKTNENLFDVTYKNIIK